MPPEFSIRSDSVDVDQIMKQIRARIREKRGVDYTEDELRQLASIKLETFLDPSRVRSDLVDHYRRRRESRSEPVLEPALKNYVFDDHLVYGSSRGVGGRLIMWCRRLLNPVLKLLINPNPIIHVLHRQVELNDHNAAQFERVAQHLANAEKVRADLAALDYEVVHNLVLELTRLGIEVKNLKMRVESLSGRLDFSDRRARSLESVVEYRPGSGPADERAEATPAAPQASKPRTGVPEREAAGAGAPIKGEAQRARRRRKRRGRGGAASPAQAGTEQEEAGAATAGEAEAEPATDRAETPGSADDGLPFDGSQPGGSQTPEPDPGEPTDQ